MLYFGEDVSAYFAAWGAGLFLVLVGKAIRSESRALMLGVCLAVIAPSPASLIVAGILALFTRLVDMIHIGEGG